MGTEITQDLLDLAAAALSCGVEQLRVDLERGHELYCAGLAATAQSVRERCAGLRDHDLAAWCALENVPWQAGSAREDAIDELCFAVWTSTPAAMAYAALADQAEQRDVWLVDSHHQTP
ncbi:hypothetical protein PH213_33570 [Streptomyces sp. SRF1]|uniref:hypothetical protein n=1 Tax=Streptomyces sp. SRF1 TaxID=1549642 RepID=UPI0025B20082|nr:hypothetical protein [Streptomyces sp. SRF1]MDN3059380.1 hypothetical protein [Streptomyces sp. SRF1]